MIIIGIETRCPQCEKDQPHEYVLEYKTAVCSGCRLRHKVGVYRILKQSYTTVITRTLLKGRIKNLERQLDELKGHYARLVVQNTDPILDPQSEFNEEHNTEDLAQDDEPAAEYFEGDY